MNESPGEFYVQLMSNASTSEFPDNKVNSFMNRLSNPLQLREYGWKVSISDLSFPSAVRKMDLKDSLLFEIWWIDMVNADRNIHAGLWSDERGRFGIHAEDRYRVTERDTRSIHA